MSASPVSRPTHPGKGARRRPWLALACLVVSTCGPRAPDRPPDAAPRPAAPDAGTTTATAETPVLRRSRALMGTIFEILVFERPAQAPGTEAAIRAAFDEISRLEGLLSEWRPNSQVSRVNAGAGRGPVVVGAEVVEALLEARRVSEASHGAFDATWAALRGLWSFRSEEGTPPPAAQARARAKLVDYRRARIDPVARTVSLELPGMALGLGGIAKGYALDRAARILRDRGLSDFVLYAGGQVLVSGRRGDRPWRVGIQHPRRPDAYFAYFSPGEGSVSTSGDYEHFFLHDGVRYHHLLDPKTGWPAGRTVAVTVVAPRGVVADAWSTALFVLGPEEGLALAEREGLEALFIDPQMRITMTPGIRRDLAFTMPLGTTEAADGGPAAAQR